MLLAAGVDIGGSHVSAGVVSEEGRLLCKGTVPLKDSFEPRRVAALTAGLVADCAREAGRMEGSMTKPRLAGVGIGVPGLVRGQEGVVALAPNFGWREVEVGEVFREGLRGLVGDIRIDNDANLAALGEYWAGAARDCEVAVCVTLGTGIGAGIVAGGEIFHGATGFAGEIGHVRIGDGGEQCGCGSRGCLETVSSGSAIARLGSAAMGRPVTAKDVLDAARAGDETALRIVFDAGACLGRVLAVMVSILDPSVIVLGGAVSLAGDAILNPVEGEMRRLCQFRPPPRVVAAALGPDAAIMGGAALFLAQGRPARR